MIQKLELKERLTKIIEDSYLILCNKISNGSLSLENEASMQLQFGIIIGNVGKLYEFSENEHFSLSLEKVFKINSTCKSTKGNARCDLFLRIESDSEVYRAGIELKYFPADKQATITANRFAILMDIENIEEYIANKDIDLGYVITYTTDKNYSDPNSRSYLKIGNGHTLCGEIKSNGDAVKLKGYYELTWDNIETDYFLKIKVQNN